MTFDLRQLAAFLAIVDRGSLGRAAEALHVTQPALSRTVRRLEEQVGAPLFERHSRGMAPTPVGEALLPHARLLTREAEVAREEIDALRGLAKGTLKVGAIASVASLMLPQALDRLLERWPNLRVRIVEGVWDRLADALVGHEIDLALGVALPGSEEIVPIADCSWQDASHVVASPDHPLRRRAGAVLADTLAWRWALPPRGTEPHEDIRRLFVSSGLEVPEIVVETRSVTTLKSLVTRAGFLSWLAEPMYDAERRAGLIEPLPIAGAVAMRRLTAFHRRQGILPGPAVKLVQELRRIAAPG